MQSVRSECAPLRARQGLTTIQPHSIVRLIGWLGPRNRRRPKAANAKRNDDGHPNGVASDPRFWAFATGVFSLHAHLSLARNTPKGSTMLQNSKPFWHI